MRRLRPARALLSANDQNHCGQVLVLKRLSSPRAASPSGEEVRRARCWSSKGGHCKLCHSRAATPAEAPGLPPSTGNSSCSLRIRSPLFGRQCARHDHARGDRGALAGRSGLGPCSMDLPFETFAGEVPRPPPAAGRRPPSTAAGAAGGGGSRRDPAGLRAGPGPPWRGAGRHRAGDDHGGAGAHGDGRPSCAPPGGFRTTTTFTGSIRSAVCGGGSAGGRHAGAGWSFRRRARRARRRWRGRGG